MYDSSTCVETVPPSGVTELADGNDLSTFSPVRLDSPRPVVRPDPQAGERGGADERQELSRELHDGVAQAIAASLNSLRLSELYGERRRVQEARTKHVDAMDTLRETLRSVKDMAGRLRSTAGTSRGDDPAEQGPHPDGFFPGSVDVGEVFTILREAVGNALAHAAATDITISLHTDGHRLLADVADDGVGTAAGLPDREDSLGLRSMAERTARLGGMFRLDPRPGGGTRISVDLPMELR